jgi:uncharacterized protein (TIRG00374 family)
VTPRAKNALLFAFKVALAAALVTWLVRGGALDFGKLRVLVDRPALLAATLGTFAFGIVMNGIRWGILLRLAGVRPSFGRLMQLQLTAVFFNVVVPGNVGGDVLKALYVARDAEPEKRTGIFLTVFADRLLGLGGLAVMAMVVTVARGPRLWNDPLLRPMAALVGLLGAATVLGPAALVLVMKTHGDKIERILGGTSRIAKLLGQLVAALRLMSARPRALAGALGVAMIYHAAVMGYFTLLTGAVSGQDASYSTIATVFPLGLLTIVLPISPAGMGVGHVAFDKLFAAIGLSGGANVFNVFIIGQIAPCLLGAFAYLGLKRESGAPPLA